MEQSECGCGTGTGTLILSFITGIAVGVASALLIDHYKDNDISGDDTESEMFI